jgi:transcriptional regulator with XRE-family HTH domain
MEAGERFAQNVRDARARRGWSQETLADASGLHRTEISLIERGGREPRLTTIVRLARALKMKPADLLENVR